MKYVIDSCVWIDFAIKGRHVDSMTKLFIDDLAYVNPIILAEIIPSARLKKESAFVECLSGIPCLELSIDWESVLDIQYFCLKSGINKLGLLDIVIAQNAKQNHMGIFSTDRHMELLSGKMGIKLKTE
jgi:predicted nucleic acid-binding protein